MYFSIIQTNNSSFTIVCWWSSLIANSMSVFRDVAFLFILRSLGSLNQSIQRCGRWIPKPRWRILWSTPSIISLARNGDYSLLNKTKFRRRVVHIFGFLSSSAKESICEADFSTALRFWNVYRIAIRSRNFSHKALCRLHAWFYFQNLTL